MAEPPDPAPAAAGRGHLRASHADREQVIDILKAAFVRGMLTKDEFDLRVGQAFASRTGGELAAFVADLPAGLTTAQPPGPARAQGQARVLRFGAVIAVATMLYAAVWPLALVLPRNGEGEPQAAIRLLVMTTFAYLMIPVLAGLELLESRRRYRAEEPHRLPGRPAGRVPGGEPGHLRARDFADEYGAGSTAERAWLSAYPAKIQAPDQLDPYGPGGPVQITGPPGPRPHRPNRSAGRGRPPFALIGRPGEHRAPQRQLLSGHRTNRLTR